MRKRETSRKRAVEAERVDELNMEDKEATPVEEVEVIIREDQGDRQEPDKVTESVDLKSLMEYLKQSSTNLMDEMRDNKQSMEESNKKNLEKLKEELSENSNCLLYTSRCV